MRIQQKEDEEDFHRLLGYTHGERYHGPQLYSNPSGETVASFLPYYWFFSSPLSLNFLSFSLLCVWGGVGLSPPLPLPLISLIISTKPLHYPPPLFLPTPLLIPVSLYVSPHLHCGMFCPPPNQPTQPLQESIPALLEYWYYHLANATVWRNQKNISQDNSNVSSLLITSSIDVGAVLGIPIGWSTCPH